MHDLTKKLHIFRHLIILAVVLMLSMGTSLPVYAAESGSCGSELNWSYSGGHLSISGSGAMTEFTDNNMPPWYGYSQEITKVTVGEGVTSIGSLAFYNCSRLNAVSLPSTLTSIGARAFKDCTSLSYAGFPAGLKTIGEAAFENCERLSGIRLPDGLRTIGDYAFYRCYGLTSITVPSSVQSFGMVVFAYCENLTQATIQCSLVRLPDWTFYGCKNLSTIVLPETVSSAGDYAFHDCDMLQEIYYNGDSAETLLEDIKKGNNSSGSITTEIHDGSGSKASSSMSEDGSVGQSQTTTVTETENSLITKDVNTSSTYQMDGKDVTIPEIAAAGENADVDVTSTKTITITSTVNNSDGWSELEEEVSESLRKNDVEKVEVSVHITDSTITGADLAKFAGKNVILHITTANGDTWKIDASTISKADAKGKNYNLSVTVTEMKAGKTKIESDTVFKVKFAEDADFRVTVGIHVGNPHQLATLYQKKLFSYEELQTVVIDGDGIAWFSFDIIEKKAAYYVGINVEGAAVEDAVIPETLYSEYGVSEDATLTDAEGNAYKVTGRASSWGITSQQFGIYAAIAVGSVVLIVALVMFTMNKLRQSKEKYQIPMQESYDDDELEPIDEEELRLEIMRELLAEAQDSQEQTKNNK